MDQDILYATGLEQLTLGRGLITPDFVVHASLYMSFQLLFKLPNEL
jgi:hypothetical protein